MGRQHPFSMSNPADSPWTTGYIGPAKRLHAGYDSRELCPECSLLQAAGHQQMANKFVQSCPEVSVEMSQLKWKSASALQQEVDRRSCVIAQGTDISLCTKQRSDQSDGQSASSHTLPTCFAHQAPIASSAWNHQGQWATVAATNKH